MRILRAAAIAAVTFGLLATSASAAPSPAAAPSGGWCNVTVGIAVPLPGNRIAFGLATPAASGRASGVLSAFTGTQRYDVRFSDAVVPTALGDGSDHSATPLVVQFPGPVTLDAAVVTGLGAPQPQPCSPYYSPYSRRTSIGWSRIEPAAAFAARAVSATPLRPFAMVPYAPAVCAQRISPPATLQAYEPDVPDEAVAKKWKGDATVLVTVDAQGRAVDARTQTSSGHPILDRIAEDAARRSQFQAGTFDCVPIVGSYLFVVSFGS